MIKRILKTKLRVYLYKSIGEAANFESAFNWAYTSPIWEWKLRVLCLSNSVDYPILNNEYQKKIVDLGKASKLWKFFHK